MNNIEFATVDIDQIEITDDRARKDFGDIAELAASIKQTGLIQPLAVYRKDGHYVLIAGERRLKAKIHNGDSTTPVRIFTGDLSPLQIRTIELHENLYRKSFEWQEQIMLQKEIHDLQQQIHGKKVSTLPDATGWSMADTAELLGKTKGSISQDYTLAEIVQSQPELFKECKNKHEAQKLVSKMTEQIVRQEISNRVQNDNSCSDTLRRLTNSYIIGDFFEVAKGIDKGIFNLVEIDPPYSIDLASVKKQESASEQSYDLEDYKEIDNSDYESFMRRMLAEAYRLGAEHSWIIVWFGPDPWFEKMYQWITEAGYKGTRLCGIWTKGFGQSLNPNTRLANSYEMFFYACKGQPILAKPGTTNEFRVSPVPPQHKIHPTERPIELMQEIYSTFVFEGSRILIPCAGSGSGIIAAYEEKMSATATDINPAYKDAYIVRLVDRFSGI